MAKSHSDAHLSVSVWYAFQYGARLVEEIARLRVQIQ